MNIKNQKSFIDLLNAKMAEEGESGMEFGNLIWSKNLF